MTDYLVYDVFTDRRFGGNPLAVFPDATDLPEGELQAIAREFNFSETTFVLPATRPGCDRKVRIFTPTMEVPFAGHPTIGTAIALRELGLAGEVMALDLGVGPIPVTVSGNQARFTTRVPLRTWDGPSPQRIAASIALTPDRIRTDRHPPVIASLGYGFALAELADREALASAAPVTDAFREIDADWPCETHYDLLAYVREGDHIEARMFAPLDGIPEDPATGSAAAALAAWLGQLEGRSQGFGISQGVAMGRPSRIDAEVTVEDGAPVEVAIAGRAVRVMEGRLLLPKH